jgi:hypothetical protein
VEIVRLAGAGHDATLASGEISPLYTETLVGWLSAREIWVANMGRPSHVDPRADG